MKELRLFGHYLNFPILTLSALDMVAAGLAIYATALWGVPREQDAVVVMAAIGGVNLFMTKWAVGLYHMRLRAGINGILSRTAVAFVIGMPVMLIAAALLPLKTEQLGFTLVACALAYGILGLLHAGFFALADAGALRRRILILGTGHYASQVTRLRRRSDRRGFEIMGFVRLDERQISETSELQLEQPISEYAQKNGVEEIVVAVDERRSVLPLDQLLECRFRGISVVELPAFIEREAGKVLIDSLRPGWLVFDSNRIGPRQEAVKRAMDVVGSFILLLLSLPITVATAVAIKIEEGWCAPILYRQTRVGKNGINFDLMKFRSMRTDAEADGKARWATQDDDRVTRVGGFIRKTRIDEIPQFLNVFRGQMSLVGPRPERPAFVGELAEVIPYYGERHRIKPGVTGWAQLLYPYGASEEDASEKLQYDLYYLKNRSVLLDIIILLQTVEVVLFGKGAR